MSGLLLLDLMLRGGIITVALAAATLLMVRAPRRPISWAMATTAILLSAYAISLSPAIFPIRGVWHDFVGAVIAVALWWLAMEMFEVGAWARRIGMPVIVAAHAVNSSFLFLTGWNGLCVMLGAGLFLHIIWVAIAGRAGDLVEERRRFRGVLLIFVAIEGLLFTYLEAIVDLSQAPIWVHPLKAGAVLALLLALCVWLLSIRAAVFPTEHADHEKPVAPAGLSTKEQAVLARLEEAMQSGAWRREGLTIGSLAEEIDTAEHRLRRVINHGLGHRNFAQFINKYRVEAACAELADPARAEKSVLEIAHAVGFASLGPFNRAFREITGASPTQYRAHPDFENVLS